MKKYFIVLVFIFSGTGLFFSYAQSGPTATPAETPVFPACADANRDNKVDMVDALMVAQCYVSINCQCEWPPCPDVDCDGDIDIIDALLIARYCVKLIDNFCCQE